MKYLLYDKIITNSSVFIWVGVAFLCPTILFLADIEV